jgi:ATP-dependent Clp protease adapter protein ClpS
MATKQENVALLERSKTKPPKLYKVILMNDDFTTMEFVIEVLKLFFSMNQERAMQVMLKIHNEACTPMTSLKQRSLRYRRLQCSMDILYDVSRRKIK